LARKGRSVATHRTSLNRCRDRSASAAPGARGQRALNALRPARRLSMTNHATHVIGNHMPSMRQRTRRPPCALAPIPVITTKGKVRPTSTSTTQTMWPRYDPNFVPAVSKGARANRALLPRSVRVETHASAASGARGEQAWLRSTQCAQPAVSEADQKHEDSDRPDDWAFPELASKRPDPEQDRRTHQAEGQHVRQRPWFVTSSPRQMHVRRATLLPEVEQS
jgi:hypothetical protein